MITERSSWLSPSPRGSTPCAATRRPSRPFLLLGVAGNLTIVILWLVTRTTEPLLGPHAGEVEEVRTLDFFCTLAEVCVVRARSVGDEGPRDGEPHTGRGRPGGVGVALLALPAPAGRILGPLIPSQSLWDRDCDPITPDPSYHLEEKIAMSVKTDNQVKLSDGRSVGYAEYGDPMEQAGLALSRLSQFTL